MRSLSASIGFLSFSQSRAAANRLGPRPPCYRTWRRRTPFAQRVEQRLRSRRVEIFVEIVVDLQDRRVDAGPQTFDLDQGEKTVGGGVPNADTELVATGANDLVGTAQPAGRRRAGLEQIASDRPQVEHRVEGGDLV